MTNELAYKGTGQKLLKMMILSARQFLQLPIPCPRLLSCEGREEGREGGREGGRCPKSNELFQGQMKGGPF